MKLMPLLRAALLLLVAASLATWAVRTFRAPVQSGIADPAPPRIADGVAVINFHGTLRCATCLRIGSLSQTVVEEGFADVVRAGKLQWLAIDFDEPGSRHFKDDYDLYSSNVVVVRRAGGRDVAWRRLDEVWDLYDDEPRFREYVGTAVADALAERDP